MQTNLRRSRRRTATLLCGLLLTGCASELTTVAPAPVVGYRDMGPAKGSACGVLVFGGTYLNFIPISLNSRVERAYNDALQGVPGATSLTNVTMQENWYYIGLGNMQCVSITGEAIK